MGILKSLSPVLIFLLLLDHNTHRYSADTCLFPPSPSPPPPMSSHSTDKPFPAKHRWREKLYFSNPAFSSSLFCPPPAVTKGKGKKSGRERRKKKHFSFQFLLLRVQAGPRLRTKEKSEKSDIVINRGEKSSCVIGVLRGVRVYARFASQGGGASASQILRRAHYFKGKKPFLFFSSHTYFSTGKALLVSCERALFLLGDENERNLSFYFSFPQRLLSWHLWRQKEKECAAYVSPLWTFSSSPILLAPFYISCERETVPD